VLAIRTARGFDGTNVLTRGVLVLIDGGRIIGVESARSDPPDGAEVLEFGDATVLPGLFDMHSHLCCDNGPRAVERLGETSDEDVATAIASNMARQLAAGVTSVRDLGDRNWAVVETRDRLRDGSIDPAPTIVASGPPITSVGGHCGPWGGEAEGEQALRRAVAQRVERGVDVVKIMASGGMTSPDTDVVAAQYSAEHLRLVVDEAHAAGLPVTAHAHALEAVERALAAGVDGIEHCTCLTTSGVQMSAALLDRLAATGTAICPTPGLLPGLTMSPQVTELRERVGLTREIALENLGRAHRAGVTIVTGADSGISPGKAHGVLPHCVADYVEAGVPVADALAMATSIAASQCQLADRKGRLAPGLDADVLVVAGDPFTDVGALAKVEAVFRFGARVPVGEPAA
jgi:imidazolonepropionase-like amidohydrolase